MPVVKGGVWSNVEDEILKASVSKYGLNQWQRVSSLLARKSAKQCKARWNEWLDPSIKKVEFSREEDEKLLHMAKLFPTQWRTIAQTVGRTATQCLDRYQKLLDEAEAREGAELGLEGPEGGETAAPSADDVRKFRPGEMDPDPETKPARPDAIDMDEDEKEMLSEARARLANTQGKKAKRKARERLLEDSRRLAVLQKRRELKHAGINIKLVHRKKGEMDYNADIPFEKQPALGFYDTHDETERNEKQRLGYDPRKAQTNSKRRTDQDEDKDDRKRRKGDKPGSAAAFASAAKAGQMQKIREAEQLSKRRALNLPAPQVGEAELEEIVKMGIIGESANKLAAQSQNESTMGLVGDYSRITASTPIRTPMQPAKEDTLRNEIQNLRALTETQSSLFGGENTPLHTSGTTGFDGATPRRHVIATPNPLAAAATPLRTGLPMGAPGATPMRTPRDTLAINQTGTGGGFGEMPGMTPRDLKIQEIEKKNKLKNAFASLPKPKATEDDFEFEIADENEDTEGPSGPTQEEDSEERDRRLREAREAQERAEFKRRTLVIQRELPRPTDLDINALFSLAEKQSETDIDRLINVEAAKLMSSDARRYPLPGAKVNGSARPLEKLEDEILDQARIEVVMELPKEVLATIQKDFLDAWNHVHNGVDILPGIAAYGDDDVDIEQLKVQAFDTAMTHLQKTAISANTLEKKLSLHYTGYIKRSNLLRTKIAEANNAIVDSKRELDTFLTLKVGEENAISRRIEKLTHEVEFVEGREREAQEVYKKRKEEYDEMVALARNLGLQEV